MGQILDVYPLCPLQAGELSLEDAYTRLLLCVVSFDAVEIQRLGPQLGLKCVDGLLQLLDSSIVSSTGRARFKG